MSAVPQTQKINPYLDALVMAGLSAGAGALGAAVFTTINPALGAGFGVINYGVSKLTDLALSKMCPQFCKANPNFSSALSFGISTGLTMAAAAGIMTLLGISFTAATLTILYVSLIAGAVLGIVAIVAGVCCIACCCASCLPKSAPQAPPPISDPVDVSMLLPEAEEV